MADFRIDRIRFKWRGDWSAGTLYVKDDVLRFFIRPVALVPAGVDGLRPFWP